MSELFNNPKYYEIAFSYRNILAEVNVFAECFNNFSKIPVNSILELGCGNAPHMEELIKRGYQYTGIDINQVMLKYSRKKAFNIGAEVKLYQRDMVNFLLDMQVDFVYVLLGSLYIKSFSEMISHFHSVAQVLKKGGCFFLEWCIYTNPPWSSEEIIRWEVERNGIQINVRVLWKEINTNEHLFEETIFLRVNDHSKISNISSTEIKRAIYYKEFLNFISTQNEFEFIGFWNNWDFKQPLRHSTNTHRPIALIRRL